MLLNACYAVWLQIPEVLEVICILEIQDEQLDTPLFLIGIEKYEQWAIYASLGLRWNSLFHPC